MDFPLQYVIYIDRYFAFTKMTSRPDSPTLDMGLTARSGEARVRDQNVSVTPGLDENGGNSPKKGSYDHSYAKLWLVTSTSSKWLLSNMDKP